MKSLLILLFLFSSFFSNANDTVTIEEIKKINKMYTEYFKKKPITFEPIEIYCTYNEHDYFSHATWFYSDMEKFSDVCKRHDCEEKLIIFEGWRSRDNKASKDNKNRKSNIELNVNNDALASPKCWHKKLSSLRLSISERSDARAAGATCSGPFSPSF